MSSHARRDMWLTRSCIVLLVAVGGVAGCAAGDETLDDQEGESATSADAINADPVPTHCYIRKRPNQPLPVDTDYCNHDDPYNRKWRMHCKLSGAFVVSTTADHNVYWRGVKVRVEHCDKGCNAFTSFCQP